MRKRFVAINSTTRVNPDLVEGMTLNTAGGRESVVLHMMSGRKVMCPTSLTMEAVEKILEGDE